MIDLHVHSTASDGFLTPAELLKNALALELEALALTDHDAVSGLPELHQAARHKNIEIINGAELAVYYPHTDMEIIALDIPKESLPAFENYQKAELSRRESLTHRRLELLQKSGYNITYQDVAYDAQGLQRTQIRRPHFADALLKKGYIKDIEEAYKGIFARGGACYVENRPAAAAEIIRFIRENDAKAVLAHPIHTKHRGEKLYTLIKELKSYGLNGIEVFHSSHPAKERREYLKIIQELNLLTAGGSDFHGGSAHPENKLGTGRQNNLHIPYFVLEAIRDKNLPLPTYYQELENYI